MKDWERTNPLSLSELLAIKNITTYVQMVRSKTDVLAQPEKTICDGQ